MINIFTYLIVGIFLASVIAFLGVWLEKAVTFLFESRKLLNTPESSQLVEESIEFKAPIRRKNDRVLLFLLGITIIGLVYIYSNLRNFFLQI